MRLVKKLLSQARVVNRVLPLICEHDELDAVQLQAADLGDPHEVPDVHLATPVLVDNHAKVENLLDFLLQLVPLTSFCRFDLVFLHGRQPWILLKH